ncbi:MAG: DUF5670 family protein [Gemmatimonadota bacterium]|nr:DUF5670 family protein [Gemmatimonadota bacterium]
MNARDTSRRRISSLEPLALPGGLVMLIVWAVGTFAFAGPGWIHFLLTLGVFLVIWGIVSQGTSKRREG